MTITLRTRLIVAFALVTAAILVLAGVGASGYRALDVELRTFSAQREDSLSRAKELLHALPHTTSDPGQVLSAMKRDLERHLSVVADGESRASGKLERFGLQLVIAALLALVILVLVWNTLHRHLLERLGAIPTFCEAGLGDPHRPRFELKGSDELTLALRRMNDLQLEHAATVARLSAVAGHDRRLVLALLQIFGAAAVVSLHGLVVASSLPDEDEKALASATARLSDASRKALAKGETSVPLRVELQDGRAVKLVPLKPSPEAAPVAWIATIG